MWKTKRRIYTELERREALELARAHGSIKYAANECGIPESTVQRWAHDARLKVDVRRSNGAPTGKRYRVNCWPLPEGMRELLAEIRRAE